MIKKIVGLIMLVFLITTIMYIAPPKEEKKVNKEEVKLLNKESRNKPESSSGDVIKKSQSSTFNTEQKKSIEKEMQELYARKQEDYIKRMKEKEKKDKYDSVTSETIEYSNIESKRVKPFELTTEVSWGVEEDEWLRNATFSPVFEHDDESRIERISIKDVEEIFIGVEKDLINEIEMPTNGGTFSYKNCEIVTNQIITCSALKSILTIYTINNDIEVRHRNNESGAFVAKLKDNKGYNFDITNNGLYNVH
jgi:hypothetical protein